MDALLQLSSAAFATIQASQSERRGIDQRTNEMDVLHPNDRDPEGRVRSGATKATGVAVGSPCIKCGEMHPERIELLRSTPEPKLDNREASRKDLKANGENCRVAKVFGEGARHRPRTNVASKPRDATPAQNVAARDGRRRRREATNEQRMRGGKETLILIVGF